MSAYWRAGWRGIRPRLHDYRQGAREYWNSKPPLEHAKTAGLVTAHVVNFGCVWHLVYEYIGGIRLMYGPSMMPTLAQEGEVCVEYTLGFQLRGLRSLERGQLITFYSPLDPSRMVVKRLAGLPGDIMCVDPTGQKAPSDQHVVVPANHLWVIGDNAAWSRDSREYGPVPVKLMRGTIVARIWPPRSICVFGNSCSPID